MTKSLVSLVECVDPYKSLREALGLCDGLARFKKSDQILIKPNIVDWEFDAPFPYLQEVE